MPVAEVSDAAQAVAELEAQRQFFLKEANTMAELKAQLDRTLRE